MPCSNLSPSAKPLIDLIILSRVACENGSFIYSVSVANACAKVHVHLCHVQLGNSE